MSLISEARELIKALRRGSFNDAEKIIEENPDIVRNDSSPLFTVIHTGSLDRIRLLIRSGVPINKHHHRKGLTPLMFAIQEASFSIIKILVHSGADLNLLGPHGYTALMYAAKYERLQVVELLCQTGADLDIRSNTNDTALTIAIRANRLDIIKVLAAAGADLQTHETILDLCPHAELTTLRFLFDSLGFSKSKHEAGRFFREERFQHFEYRTRISTFYTKGVYKELLYRDMINLEGEAVLIPTKLVKELLEYKRTVDDMVRYAPGGEGAIKTEEHFNSLAFECIDEEKFNLQDPRGC
jgi:hypothetical protein